MKLLLTSAGLTNATVTSALESLLGKPLGDSRAIFIPTAIHAMPQGVDYAWHMLGSARPDAWANLGILELTALESARPTDWMPSLEAADAVLVGGGNTPYLSYWFHRSGFADVLPALLPSTVYAGISAGSMVVASRFRVDHERLAREGVYDDDLYGDVAPTGFGSDRTLGLVDFAIMPHLHSPFFDDLPLARIEEHVVGPTYVLDDHSAVLVDDGDVRVASEGEWHLR